MLWFLLPAVFKEKRRDYVLPPAHQEICNFHISLAIIARILKFDNAIPLINFIPG